MKCTSCIPFFHGAVHILLTSAGCAAERNVKLMNKPSAAAFAYAQSVLQPVAHDRYVLVRLLLCATWAVGLWISMSRVDHCTSCRSAHSWLDSCNSGHVRVRLLALQVFDLGGGTLDVAVPYVPSEKHVQGAML